ncbi:6-phosphogluconolactonase [Cellvibrio japonicus]|uniref:6-phosphogluconolactonase n=1 Tax=Cellvibrio japonicus (strain Ueda107) TaxID=498211 RepID=B3PCY8_CELJU|nr:6-phosphogluconolactonase [Cellvibrio japonicus]ACE83190.1 6-phosphogluconolactonase [Cellvibrio japonicus Ueda107]QEI11931.1 6-phosphogluconolactonase [Cellvibrio japonicus]QEI15505.1 6-phosphogluconolactonase [Cellvibrio japonicus]QEI19084.1 6-phosphogluconolactonase [Cellvibrio japonicus]
MVIERLFDSRAEMIAALQVECEAALRNAIEERGEATFMVSGGSTPEPLYKALSEVGLDWELVYVALVDERWVAFDHPRSNEAFVVRSLVQNKAASTNLIGMKNTAATPEEGLADCEVAYQQLSQPYAITILGMGSDGHTASWFPNAQGLDKALTTDQLCAAVTAQQSAVTGEEVERMTLSLNGVLQSKTLVLLLTGEEKLQVFRAAQAGTQVHDMPIRALLQQQQVPLTLYWAP